MPIIIPALMALLGVALSVYFTVSLLAVSVTPQLAIGMGALLGVGQFYSLSQPRSHAWRFVAVVLFSVSVAATYLDLERRASTDMQTLNAIKHAEITNAITSTDQYRLTKQTILQLDAQIDSIQQTINSDIANSYRTRAAQQQKQLEGMIERRTGLVATLEQQPPPQITTEKHLYDSVAEHYRQVVIALVSLMLELVTALAVLEVIQLMKRRETPPIQRQRESPESAAPTRVEHPIHPTETPASHDTDSVLRTIAETPVSARAIQRETGLSVRRVKRAVEHLAEQQRITQNEAKLWTMI